MGVLGNTATSDAQQEIAAAGAAARARRKALAAARALETGAVPAGKAERVVPARQLARERAADRIAKRRKLRAEGEILLGDSDDDCVAAPVVAVDLDDDGPTETVVAGGEECVSVEQPSAPKPPVEPKPADVGTWI